MNDQPGQSHARVIGATGATFGVVAVFAAIAAATAPVRVDAASPASPGPGAGAWTCQVPDRAIATASAPTISQASSSQPAHAVTGGS